MLVEKERKKAEKQAKFDQKKAKVATAATVPLSSKSKEKKAKAAEKAEEEVLPEYKEITPAGEKKSEWHRQNDTASY
jgi:valyl-tRNA synthetase